MKVKEILEYYEKFIDVLLEAVNYNQMFSPTLIQYVSGGKVNNSVIKETIAKAKRILKREDRIVWFLRLYKMKMIATALDTNKTPEFKTYADKELQKYNKKSSTILTLNNFKRLASLDRVLTKLEHYYSMNVHKIETYEFKYQFPILVLEKFEQWEQEHIAKNSGARFVVERNEEVFLDCGGGWVWFDLKRGYCKEEGDAMGHCGNDGYQDSAERTIISLRKKVQQDKKVFWQPHATAIYIIADKSIEQVKGVNNSKPDQNLSPQIFKLFMDDRIQAFERGSYKPEEDFRPDDLSDDFKDKLKEEKPDLFKFISNVYKDIRENGFTAENIKMLRADFHISEHEVLYSSSYGTYGDFAINYNDEIISAIGKLKYDADDVENSDDYLYLADAEAEKYRDDLDEHIMHNKLSNYSDTDFIEELMKFGGKEDVKDVENFATFIKDISKELYEQVQTEFFRAIGDAVIVNMIDAVDQKLRYTSNESDIDLGFSGDYSEHVEYGVKLRTVERLIKGNDDINSEEALRDATFELVNDLDLSVEPFSEEGWFDYNNDDLDENVWLPDTKYYINEFLGKKKNES